MFDNKKVSQKLQNKLKIIIVLNSNFHFCLPMYGGESISEFTFRNGVHMGTCYRRKLKQIAVESSN